MKSLDEWIIEHEKLNNDIQAHIDIFCDNQVAEKYKDSLLRCIMISIRQEIEGRIK